MVTRMARVSAEVEKQTGPSDMASKGYAKKGGIPYQTQGRTQRGLAPRSDKALILLDEDLIGRSAVRIQGGRKRK